jgi:ubiquitin-conjugating enzyme E2 J1
LPAEYPFKPPNIVFTTKNGRFEVGTKICLSISAHHEESWQPAWGVRTMLEAIISFLPSEGVGAIGALDWTKEERQKLAKESRACVCSLCGKISELCTPIDEDDEDKPDNDIISQISQLNLISRTPSTDLNSNLSPNKSNPDRNIPKNASISSQISSNVSSNKDTSEEKEKEIEKNVEEEISTTPLKLMVPNTNEPKIRSNLETPPSVKAVRRRVFAARGESDPNLNSIYNSTREIDTSPQIINHEVNTMGNNSEAIGQIPQIQGRDWVDELLLISLVIITLMIIYMVGKKTSYNTDSYSNPEL